MTGSFWLLDHPPARQQFTKRGGALVTAIIVHTAESALDVVGGDGGAEAVARFIAGRTDKAGSYHVLVDSDSIVPMVPPELAALHCRGVNEFTFGLSFACRAWDWAKMDPWRRDSFLINGAVAAVDAVDWIESQPGAGPFSFLRRTATEVKQGRRGFASHAVMDPTRRTDPGPDFPWTRFLELAENEYRRRRSLTDGKDTMAKTRKIDVQVGVAPTLTGFGLLMASVDELYVLHRGAYPGVDERKVWAADLRAKVLAGAEVEETLEFIDWALQNPGEAAKLGGGQ